jgi:ABC-type branched-subunit amino acid transport system ATPase component/ABC-type branched-subunit amino acid transport system permease subunit
VPKKPKDTRPARPSRAERRAKRQAERPRLPFRQAVKVYAPWLALLGALVAYPYLVTEFWALIGSFVAVYALVALSLTVLTGWTGAVSLGQASFVGLGAFVAAYLTREGVPFAAWIPLAVAASIPASLLTGLAALRLPGLYFAVATLAFNLAAQFLIFIPVENEGIEGIARPRIFSVDFDNERLFFLLVCVLVIPCFGAVLRVGRGKTGRALLSVRNSATAAAALGINPVYYRIVAFVLSGALAAIAGVLLGALIESANSNQYTPFTSIGYLANAIIGGLGSVLGAVLAGAAQRLPLEAVRPLIESNPLQLAQFTPLFQSALLLVFIVARPDGLVGLGRALAVRLGWRRPRPARELAFLPRISGGTQPLSSFSLGDFTAPPGALLSVFGEREEEVDGEIAPAALDVTGVSVRFGAVQALTDVSLRIEPGELVGVIGPNGAGKTTLFNVCSGFQAPVAGRVVLDGLDITRLGASARVDAGLGRTFQTPRLVASMSVFENLLVAAHPRLRHGLPAEILGFSYALRDEAAERERVGRLLDVLGLSDLAERAAGDLPSGLLKVVEVARALVEEPRVLLLDEPSAGLDPSETRWLGDLIRSVVGEIGVSVALIEHDMSLVMGVSDFIYVLESGTLLAAGRPEAIRRDPRVIAAYLGAEEAA